MPHIGKIGRLPKHLRHQLGLRLEDNVPGSEILQWLNAQPETQSILNRYFHDRPITEQNLSEWRQSGHQDWLRHQEAKAAIGNILEQAEDIEGLADGQNLSDRFAAILAVEMTRLARALLEPETDPEKKWERLCNIHRELSRLRRDDDRAARTAIRKERSEREEEEHRKQAAEARKDQQKSVMHLSLLDQLTDHVRGKSTQTTVKRPPFPAPVLPAKPNPSVHTVPKPTLNPKESSRIQPNPTKNDKPATHL